jgi:hypothetical protein
MWSTVNIPQLDNEITYSHEKIELLKCGWSKDETSVCMPPLSSLPVYMFMLHQAALVLQFWFSPYSLPFFSNTSLQIAGFHKLSTSSRLWSGVHIMVSYLFLLFMMLKNGLQLPWDWTNSAYKWAITFRSLVITHVLTYMQSLLLNNFITHDNTSWVPC